MKKRILILWWVICLFIIFVGNIKAYAVDISIGASLWYSDWMPAWEDGKTYMQPNFIGAQNIPVSLPYEINKFETQWAPMYGPVLSIGFLEKWNIASVFMFGTYFSKSTGDIIFYGTPFFDTEYSREIKKYDSDTTISYTFHKYIKIYIGFKYQAYTYEEKLYYIPSAAIYKAGGSSFFQQYGPGLGLGFTIPLYRGLFLLYNLSVSYFFGSAEYDMEYEWFFDGSFSAYNYSTFNGERFSSVAGNTSLALAYYIEPANLTLSLGFRYQVLYFFHDRIRKGFLDYKGKYEHFYGGTFTATYSFHFGGKNDKG